MVRNPPPFPKDSANVGSLIPVAYEKRIRVPVNTWPPLNASSVNDALGTHLFPKLSLCTVDRQLKATQKIILPGPLIEIGKNCVGCPVHCEDVCTVEVPFILHAAHAVVVTRPQTQGSPIVQLRAEVCAFERIRVIVIR